jgi:hypothetical protein
VEPACSAKRVTRAAMDLDVLKVKFTHSNTVRDKKPFTVSTADCAFPCLLWLTSGVAALLDL